MVEDHARPGLPQLKYPIPPRLPEPVFFFPRKRMKNDIRLVCLNGGDEGGNTLFIKCVVFVDVGDEFSLGKPESRIAWIGSSHQAANMARPRIRSTFRQIYKLKAVVVQRGNSFVRIIFALIAGYDDLQILSTSACASKATPAQQASFLDPTS